jgi:hypothetical protein
MKSAKDKNLLNRIALSLIFFTDLAKGNQVHPMSQLHFDTSRRDTRKCDVIHGQPCGHISVTSFTNEISTPHIFALMAVSMHWQGRLLPRAPDY